ncbi:MAG: MFS transporter [Spirochaetes bacterium]|nr:MFS transporter [Spirochaetota bacterium]
MKEGFVVPTGEKIAYGMGDMAINIAYGAMNFYFLFFLTNVAGISAVVAGGIIMAAVAWDAITDYWMGLISDRTSTRMGRRRPFILFGAVPFGLCYALLWLVPFDDPRALAAYYFVIVILYKVAFTVVSIPYNSLHPELSQNYDERTSISGYRMSLSFVGTLLAAAGIMLVVDVLFPGRPAYGRSYPVQGMIFGAFMTVILLVTFAGTKERTPAVAPHAAFQGFFKSLSSTLALREFRYVLGMFIFNMVGFDLMSALLVFFLKDVIHIPEDFTFIIMAVPLVVAVASAPLWVYLGERWGKRKAYRTAALYLAMVFLACLVAPVGSKPFVIGVCVLAGVGISASQVIPFSIIPDVIEVDEYEHGTRREGAFYGVIMFLYKVSAAVAINVASLLLGLFGYVESTAGQITAQPASALWAVRILIGVGPGLCFLVSAFFVHRLPITRERFDEIKRIIQERKGSGAPAGK